jgi:hypothetical protein
MKGTTNLQTSNMWCLYSKGWLQDIMSATAAYADEFKYMDNNIGSKRAVAEGTTVPMESKLR